MKIADKVKPISQLKADAPNVLRGVAEDHEPVIITVRGEAAAVLQDVKSYQETQDTLALLKIMALSKKAAEEGEVKPMADMFADIRRRNKT